MRIRFTNLTLLSVMLLLTLVLVRCTSSTPHIVRCEARPTAIVSSGSTFVAAHINAPASLTFAWSQLTPAAPRRDVTSPTTLWTDFLAPVVTKRTKFHLQMQVTDPRGQSSTCKVAVTVEAQEKNPHTWGEVLRLIATETSTPQERKSGRKPN